MNNELNVFPAKDDRIGNFQSATAEMAKTRQAQEVQAAMIVAKRFPRDEHESCNRILAACSRKTLAEASMYEFTKGGTTITGPSIRLAEAMAQGWGNIDFGYVELEQGLKESKVMAYAWDLETNTRQSKVFTVPHIRHTRNGDYPLTDPRDIYENVANQAARRIRSCILAIIPGDVIDTAVKQCELTLASGEEPLPQRIAKMVNAYAEFDITPEMLAGFNGKKTEAFSLTDVVRLGKIYRSLKDGVVGSDYFSNAMKDAASPQAPTVEGPGADPIGADGEPGVAEVRMEDL